MKVGWNNVVSQERNDIVFEGRNRAYGAFVLRSTYNKTVTIIVGSVLFATLLGYGIKTVLDMKGAEEELANVQIDVTQLDLTPPALDKNEPPPPPPPPPPPVIETVKFVPPVIKDDAVEDEPPPPQEKLTETNVGTTTQEGNGDENIVVPEETGTGNVIQEAAPEIFTVVEQMPEFPGGTAALMKFIQQNIQYPQVEKEAGISGKVFVKFVVQSDGKIGAVEILKGVAGGKGLEREAERVVKSMPAWTPGKQNGRSVNVWFNLPINFQLK
jgi:protein TonB